MSNTSNISLSSLIKNIADARTIRKILSTYDKQLEAANQYDVKIIFPILTEQIRVVDNEYKHSIASLNEFHQSIGEFMMLALSSTQDAAALSNTIQAADVDSSLSASSQELKSKLDVFYSFAQKIQDAINNELINATDKVDIIRIKSVLEMMKEKLTDRTYHSDWVVSQIEKSSNKLHGDVRALSNNSLLKQMAVFYEKLQQLVISINDLCELIMHIKSVNALIENNIVRTITKLCEDAIQLDRMYLKSLNLAYRHSDDLLRINNAVLVYQTFANILEKQKSRT